MLTDLDDLPKVETMSTPRLVKEEALPIVLASASQVRAAMLRKVGIDPLIQPASVDEEEIKTSFKASGGAAGEAAIALADLKAGRVAAALPEETIVLGADQILTSGDDWFSKPVDLAAARRQLERLSGERHELHTAVVAFRGRQRVWHHLDRTSLTMRPLSASFLESYLELVGYAALETLGGYHIEKLGPHLFSRIEGDYFAILGLPLLPVLAFLRDQGVLLA